MGLGARVYLEFLKAGQQVRYLPKPFLIVKPAVKADLTGGDEVNAVSSGCVIFVGDTILDLNSSAR